jgi:hypothetical protein
MSDGTSGVYTSITDWNACRPCALSAHLLRQACAWGGNPFTSTSKSARELFIKHWGREVDFESFRRNGARTPVEQMTRGWENEAATFRAATLPYRIPAYT